LLYHELSTVIREKNMQKQDHTTVDNMHNLRQNQSSSETALLESFEHNQVSDHDRAHQDHIQTRPRIQRTGTEMKANKTPLLVVISIVAIVAGIGTGYGGFKLQTKATTNVTSTGSGEIQQIAEEGKIKAGDVFGVNDEETFKDSAEGYLEIGGLNGEGSHKLLRAGGETQTVYLTSSITDLDQFDGMEVKVAGETFKGQKAGWLMDVGRVEVVSVKGEAPATN
jgi:hypothetical protein